ncbi:hypothetical protein QJS66_17390 [Kocuria rhizophila]|nr:hypothetical protein QJS66_17390 [Kocuria rhizophila]
MSMADNSTASIGPRNCTRRSWSLENPHGSTAGGGWGCGDRGAGAARPHPLGRRLDAEWTQRDDQMVEAGTLVRGCPRRSSPTPSRRFSHSRGRGACGGAHLHLHQDPEGERAHEQLGRTLQVMKETLNKRFSGAMRGAP